MGIFKIFILGLPGSGKTTVADHIAQYIKQQYTNWFVVSINDYDILWEMYQQDTERKRFLSTEEIEEIEGFIVLDPTVWNIALKNLEERENQRQKQSKYTQASSIERSELVVIEFARNNYIDAFQQFNDDFLQDSCFLFLDVGISTDIDVAIELCRERIRERVERGKGHHVSAIILKEYYAKDRGNYSSLDLKTGSSIEIPKSKIKVIDNSGEFTDEIKQEINSFVDSLITQINADDHP